jgi:hypothetical protein
VSRTHKETGAVTDTATGVLNGVGATVDGVAGGVTGLKRQLLGGGGLLGGSQDAPADGNSTSTEDSPAGGLVSGITNTVGGVVGGVVDTAGEMGTFCDMMNRSLT